MSKDFIEVINILDGVMNVFIINFPSKPAFVLPLTSLAKHHVFTGLLLASENELI